MNTFAQIAVLQTLMGALSGLIKTGAPEVAAAAATEHRALSERLESLMMGRLPDGGEPDEKAA